MIWSWNVFVPCEALHTDIAKATRELLKAKDGANPAAYCTQKILA